MPPSTVEPSSRANRQYVIGVILVALTVIGLLAFWALNPQGQGDDALLLDIGVIMAIALVKAYLVGAEYMELRRSVRRLRYLFGAWLGVTWAAIMIATYLGMHTDTYIHFL